VTAQIDNLRALTTTIMQGVNKVILLGNLGKDPEMRYTEGNVARLNFTVATTEYFKDKNGQRNDHTEWHNVVMWRSLAENGEKLLRKGTQVYIEGRLQSRQWTDKEGHKRHVTEIVADQFIVLQKSSGADTPKDTAGDLPY
jgi:single-strand DNA-binding protein